MECNINIMSQNQPKVAHGDNQVIPDELISIHGQYEPSMNNCMQGNSEPLLQLAINDNENSKKEKKDKKSGQKNTKSKAKKPAKKTTKAG